MHLKNTKWIIVTGGVLSGLGKGIVSASIGRLLSSKLKVVPIKCDGYLNVDPGTMNPIEHGEVFVLDDGGEVDMDFGHYERFLNINCKFNWNLTSGKVFKSVIDKERKGDYLGKTVQMIPHVTDEIKNRFFSIAKEEDADIMLIEIGGTVGDIENMLFIEAVRQLKREVGKDNIIYVHLTYVPVLSAVAEQKSKPTQQSISMLEQRGIKADIIIGRSEKPLAEHIKKKIALFASVDEEDVISDPHTNSVYELPLIFEKEGLLERIKEKLLLPDTSDLKKWRVLVGRIKKPKAVVSIAICGKYTQLMDSYVSVVEALTHAGAHLGLGVDVHWIDTSALEKDKTLTPDMVFHDIDGIIVPGGFGIRGTEGKIKVVQYARENNIPFLGLCYGFQLAVTEFARNVCGLNSAGSTEVNKRFKHPVIDLLPEQKGVEDMGGTMRLGGHDVKVISKTSAYKMFGKTVRRRFRHRYEVNPDYIDTLTSKGLIFSGKAPVKDIMQILELPTHPFFMASQFHPELTSRLEDPSELFSGFMSSAYSYKNKRVK